MLVSARSASEYRRMFNLDGVQAGAKILDCGAGAASFAAEVRGEFLVTCIDPLYSLDDAALEISVLDGIRETQANIRRDPSLYTWGDSSFPSTTEHSRSRVDSAERFLSDYRSHPEGYIAGSVSNLPFANESFDHCLVSHLLFLHAPEVSLDFHARAVRELTRVARKDVRIYPLVSFDGTDLSSILDVVLTCAREANWTATVQSVSYSFFKGAHEMLVLSSSSGDV